MKQTIWTDYAELEIILKQVELEYQMSGLSSGLYGDYAKEVAKRYYSYKKRNSHKDDVSLVTN